jgi:hypothetical protein
MVNASHHYLRLPALKVRRAYDEQIIARPRPGVQPQDFLWFPAGGGKELKDAQKKSRRFRRL